MLSILYAGPTLKQHRRNLSYKYMQRIRVFFLSSIVATLAQKYKIAPSVDFCV